MFCKQKTAYDMRISDWSSDVCSSDLFERLNPADRGIQCKFRPICLHIPIYRPNFATSHFYSPLVQSIANLPPANTARAKTDMNVQTQTEPSNAMDGSIDPYATTLEQVRQRMNLAKKVLETIQKQNISEPRSEEHTSELQSLMPISYA